MRTNKVRTWEQAVSGAGQSLRLSPLGLLALRLSGHPCFRSVCLCVGPHGLHQLPPGPGNMKPFASETVEEQTLGPGPLH